MKKIHWFCSVAMLLVATACSKNDDVDTSLLKVEAPMAEFASVTEFEATVLRLMKSSLEEQIAWCQENNIVSQCMLYDQAIDELEKIQELRDTTEYYHFKEKYSPYFLFNENDVYDLNPYIPSNDLGNNLVCNINGDVKIDGEVVNFNDLTSFEETTYGKYLEEVVHGRSKPGDLVEEKTNYLQIVEGGDRKMWAEAQRKYGEVYIKLSAHKKGWLGGWNNYKTTYFIKYANQELAS